MLDMKAAKDIDKAHLFYGEALEDQMKSLSTVGMSEVDRMVTIYPELFVEEIYANSYHDGYAENLKLSKSKSTLNIEIKSLVTQEKQKILDSKSIRIRTPYPNKKYLVGGGIKERKFIKGFTFFPEESECLSIKSSAMDDLFDNTELHRSISNARIVDYYSEKVEYNSQNPKPFVDNTSVRGKTSDMYYEKRKEELEKFHKYLDQKYDCYPYEITEKWDLVLERKSMGVLETFQANSVEIKRFLFVMRYKKKYLDKCIEKAELLAEIAICGNHFVPSFEVTKFGRIYSCGKLDTKVRIAFNEFSINNEILVRPVINLENYDYILKVSENNQDVKFIYSSPFVSSMIPILK